MARHIRNSLYSQTVEGPLAYGGTVEELGGAAEEPIVSPTRSETGINVIIYLVGLSEGLTHLAALAIYYLLKDDLGVSPATTSAVLILPALPWFLKPALAFLSDTTPIFGLRRKPYLIAFSVLEALGYYLLAVCSDSLVAVASSLTIISLGAAFCSAVTEALVVESSHVAAVATPPTTQQPTGVLTTIAHSLSVIDDQEAAQAAANASVTELLGAKAIGSLIVAYLSGALLEIYTKHQVFLATALFPLLITIAGLFYREAPHVEEELEEAVRLQPGDEADGAAPPPRRSISRIKIKLLVDFLKQRVVWGPGAFIVMFMMGPDYDDALFYFYTSKLQFSPSFMGSLRFTYGLAALLGLLAYNKALKNVSYRRIMIWTICVNLPVYISPLLLVSGLNRRMGINDKVFVLSGGFLIEAVAELQLLPLLIYTALICPPGLEGSVYSVMMSVRNLGAALGKLSSSIAAYAFGITATNFSNLIPFIVVCGVFTLIPLPFIHLIPTTDEMEQIRKANLKARYDKTHKPPLITSQAVWNDITRLSEGVESSSATSR